MVFWLPPQHPSSDWRYMVLEGANCFILEMLILNIFDSD